MTYRYQIHCSLQDFGKCKFAQIYMNFNKIFALGFKGLKEVWSNFCLKDEFLEYKTFVLLQNIEHFNSNLVKNHHSGWQV